MIRRLGKKEHGQALVEMALVLPLFLLLLFGVIEMGRIGHAYITISNAAGVGGRMASIGGTDDQIETAIENVVTTLDYTSLTIDIDPNEANRQSGENIEVSVLYKVELIIPLISMMSDSVNVSSSIIMRME